MNLDPNFEWMDITPIDKAPGTEFIRIRCNHLHLESVEALDGEVVARLCLTCDEQLPAPREVPSYVIEYR